MKWEPTVCFACRRSAYGKLKNNREVCLECSYAPGIVEFSSKPIDVYEQCAIAEMVAQVREHLGMSEEETFEFVKFVFLGVGDIIRQQIRSGKPPF